MFSWLKHKPRLASHGQYPPEITRAIHTMADDMGKLTQAEAVAQEPLVAFQPGQASGAVFYAAPEILEPTTSSPLTASPFLSDASPVASPRVSEEENSSIPQGEEAMLLNQMRELETATPVTTSSPATSEVSPSTAVFSWREKLHQYKVWILGISIPILLLVGAVFWYWWQSRAQTPPPVVSEGVVKEVPPTIEIKVEKEEEPTRTHYSIDQPNLLSFDTETVTAESIVIEFLKVALSIKQDNLRQPVEFLARDQNYNPLAFSRFAYLLNLDLSPEILSTLDEDFSLFFFLDQEWSRMGLLLTIKDKVAFTEALKTGEMTLPKTWEPFYLDKTTAPKTGLTFRSGIYQDQPLRYVNIDSTINLSVDYVVRENQWIIGTSQNTLRALLDQKN